MRSLIAKLPLIGRVVKIQPQTKPWHVADELLAATMDVIESILPDRGDSTIPAARTLKHAVHEQGIDPEPNKLKLRESLDVLEYVISKLKELG